MRMTLPATLLLLAAVAGCDRPPPPRAPAAVRSALDTTPDGPAPPITIKPSFQCPRPVVEGEPQLPLDAPLTDLQKLICDEPELALLDRQAHQAYLAARLRRGVDRAGLSRAERQWQDNRKVCLKAPDPRACAAETSRTRLVELALQDPATVARTRLDFACKGTATPLTAAFYSQLKPAFAVLGFGDQQAIVFAEPTHSGLKYGRTGVDFFVRKGQVTADFYGRALACRSPTWRPAEEAPTRLAAQATDALVEQVSRTTSASTSASPVPNAPPSSGSANAAEVATAAPVVQAPVRQGAPTAPTSAPWPASVQAPVTASAPVADAPTGPLASPAPAPRAAVRSPVAPGAPARDAAAQATDALVRQTLSPAPRPPARRGHRQLRAPTHPPAPRRRLPRPDPRSLSDFGRPGCKSGCAVHISVASCPIEPLCMGRRIGENLSSRSRIFASTAKARQTPSVVFHSVWNLSADWRGSPSAGCRGRFWSR
ncbi:lipoprotein lprI [Pseudoxanthomonas spadix BD-a59]|uniref:Lipoprotein lprI n=1 Tax=Pseudoxanthomonas spadix (strain BD-a59) TaxID=1045855 RepID=G7UTN2_PSEUP|nr:MliC family protein [Pseudoxanthomonas spadix]AER54933.1 lipoprotein lprI [Pseudoxanthomonas spadix BD-a59]